uniref:Dehydrogenase/reductase SDR family member 4 n=1 Tax=Cryptomonas curvata TaxID=233186 RepID=A0A7S0M055_9CRYP
MAMAAIQRLLGKTAIVTASTAGIGFAIARRLAREGANVAISSRKSENVAKAVSDLQREGLSVLGIPCHVGKADDRTRLVQETCSSFGGKVDILVSNAAVNPAYGPLQDTTADQWDKIFDINVKAAFLLSKEVIPIMKKQGGGSIVMISSIAAFTAIQNLGAYSVSKTALIGLAKAIAAEHAADRIRCNAVAPGIIKTRFSEALWSDPAQETQVVQQVPLGRLGEGDDISGVAAFLASDDSQYVTGETIVAAGGMLPARF